MARAQCPICGRWHDDASCGDDRCAVCFCSRYSADPTPPQPRLYSLAELEQLLFFEADADTKGFQYDGDAAPADAFLGWLKAREAEAGAVVRGKDVPPPGSRPG